MISQPTINVLIRNKYRPELLGRCLHSVKEQTVAKSLNVIICSDSYIAEADAKEKTENFPSKVSLIDAEIDVNYPFYWNLYSNQLKNLVTEGWFFFLDNDDFLFSKTSLETISAKLTNPEKGVVCQMLRRSRPKPPMDFIENKKVVKGKIGAPCLFLHHSKKDIANWDGYKAADYRWIKDVEKVLPLKFVPIVVVQTGNNGLKGQ